MSLSGVQLPAAPAADRSVPATDGAQTSRAGRSWPARLLRLEGAALLGAATLVYFYHGGSWLVFLALLLAPDLALVGYRRGPRLGSLLYNLAHTTTLPLLLAGGALLAGNTSGLLLAAIWLAHIGLDRMVGYGLKYPTAFKDTHLDRV